MHDLEFYTIVDSTYPWFPPDDDRESISIDMTNGFYDADLGQHVYERVERTAQLAERLGYDGTLVFEQHGHPLALFNNALTGAAWIAAKTEGIRVVAAGPIANAYLTPVRMAEEIAMVDTLSGGRLTVGLPMGIGPQYHALGIPNPSHARERYYEAVELLYKIWTQEGPFAWEGEWFHIPYVNVWPRQRQVPHPDVFIPSGGSRETLEMAAKYRFTYQAHLVPMPQLLRNCNQFRELCNDNGYESDPRQITAVMGVYVAESDAEARRDFERHELWANQHVLRYPFHESFPPGYMSLPSLKGMLSQGYHVGNADQLDWDTMVKAGMVIAGSPETVRERIAELTGAMGAGRVIVQSSFSAPEWMLQKTMTLFAEEVMPHFRTGDTRAVWQREPATAFKTTTEMVGRHPRVAGVPMVDVPGRGRVELYERDPLPE
jgi:alkanesulfonate monooxygenase SsuD/methylene tetrahydromethanopterin reductase-like flavin-dependent oxidoreductase (luciferase family)